MKSIGKVFLALIICAGVVSGCAEKKEPAEKATEAMEAAGEAVKDVGEEAGEAAGEMKEEAVEGMEEMKEEAGEAGEKMGEAATEMKAAAAEGMEAAGEKMTGAVEAVEEKTAEAMTSAEDMLSPESVEKGAALYKAKCAACHGTDGKGTAMAPAFVANEWIDAAAHDELADVIVNGRQGAAKRYKKFALGMPAQKGMSEEDISALIDYMKSIN